MRRTRGWEGALIKYEFHVGGLYHVDDAVRIAEESMNHILQMSEEFCDKTPNKGDPKVDEILDMVQWNIMRFAVKDELERTEN